MSADETVTTLYLGEGFEWIRTQSGGDTRVQSRITVGGVVLNYHEQTDCRSVHYRHRDRLGSTTALSNHQGMVVERYGYDAFGKVRTANWQSDRVVPGDLSRAVGLHSRLTTRGFTDHEHLDNVGLIHMNGRAYDPALGRFMSVDPFIALPEDSQSLNPRVLLTFGVQFLLKFSGSQARQSACSVVILRQ